LLHLAHLSSDAGHEHGGRLQPASPFPIGLRDCNFTYPLGQRPVLKSVDMTLSSGEFVALVGPSGSGKSTLASLLLRLYETDGPTHLDVSQEKTVSNHQNAAFCKSPQDYRRSSTGGRTNDSSLFFAKHAASRLSTGHLRSQLAYVPQRPFLSPTSIEENILLGLSASSRPS
jgi:ATP-binding cassette, subfamily B (MDR/TAP), member 1